MAQSKILYPKVKNPLAMQEMQETVLNPGSERSPREGNGNPLQYSCPENPTDRGAWRATVHVALKSRTQLSNRAWISHMSRDKGPKPTKLTCLESPWSCKESDMTEATEHIQIKIQ